MAGITEQISLGQIGVEGRFTVSLQDALTGKTKERVDDENMVCVGMGDYMRKLCTAMLGSVASNYSYIPYQNSMFAGQNYLSSIVNSVSLTDGTLPASFNHRLLDGTVIAQGNANNSAQAGSIYGALGYASLRQSSTEIYKRWDWASGNGNGTFSKIALHAERFCGTSTYDGVMANTYCEIPRNVAAYSVWHNEVWVCTAADNKKITFDRYTLDPRATTVAKDSFDIDIESFATVYSSWSNSYNKAYIVLRSKADSDTVFLFPANSVSRAGELITGTTQRRFYAYYKYKQSTGQVSAVTIVTEKPNNRMVGVGNIYLDAQDRPHIMGFIYNEAGASEYGLYRLTGTAVTKVRALETYPTEMIIYGFAEGEITGNVLQFASSSYIHEIDLLTGKNKQGNGYFGNLGWNTIHFYDGGTWYAVSSNKEGAPKFTWVEKCNSPLDVIFLATERRLDYSITKTANETMYVGYSLNLI